MSGHGHSHGGHSHQCSEQATECTAAELAAEYNLHTRIDMENLECLNECTEGTCRNIFRSWVNRLEPTTGVESDADEELLINIPFNGTVRLKGIIIIGEEGSQHPRELRLFKNRPFMTFDQAQTEPEQKLEVVHDPQGMVEHPVKITKFGSVSHLSVHIASNYGADTSKVLYLGLKGDWLGEKRSEVVITNYEVRPNLEDHDLRERNAMDANPMESA